MKQKIATLAEASTIDEKTRHLRALLAIDPDLEEATEYRGFRKVIACLGALDVIKLVEQTRTTVGSLAAINLYKTWLARGDGALPMSIAPDAEHVAAIWFNLGSEYANRDDLEKKIACYMSALSARPDFYPAAINLGLTYEAAQDPSAALALWQRALQSNEARTAILNNIGRMQETRKAAKEAKEAYTKSLLTDPDQRAVLHHLIGLRTKTCDWPIYRQDLPDVSFATMAAATRALTLLALSDDIEIQSKGNASWIEEKMPAPQPFAPRRLASRDKIRIGYLSSDFCMHPITYLMTELIETHDRHRFEIHGFCSSIEDRSPTRRRIVEAFDVFHDIRALTDDAAAKQIRDAEIDILIDLNGLTLGSRLPILQFRPAPIQITYLGYNGPMPLPELDYIIADRYVIPPEHADRYWPMPLYMDKCFQVNDSTLVCAPPPTRTEAGLPEDTFVFCCFSNTYKITEAIFGAWIAILQRAPHSVLWLYADNDDAADNMRKIASARGVDVARLIFASRVPPEVYRSRLVLADLFLDTFPYNAGTTASDALRVGLPIVTISGESFISRMAGSLLNAMGVAQGIVANIDSYIEFAVARANGDDQAALRADVSPKRWMETFGDTKAFCAELEDKLETLVLAAIKQDQEHKTEQTLGPSKRGIGARRSRVSSIGPLATSKRTRDPARPDQAGGVKSLMIEGWRGINHSFALVNQSQILALSAIDRLKLYHRDLPFALPNWNRTDNKSGLADEDQRRVDDLGLPQDDHVDCIYRICSPFRSDARAPRCKTVTFMVTEIGLAANSFHRSAEIATFTRDDNSIVTPSSWSRDRLLDWGFPAEKIDIIPHGVDTEIFRPLSSEERHANRHGLGIDDDAIVFLNVGLPCWNKGIDLLLLAFSNLREAGRNVRLILKDQRELYGRSVLDMIRELGTQHVGLVRDDTISAISVISSNLSRGELRALYGIADCYVSPYRAEGFNLPVLEAIACGTPVIVTKGGATDDFCTDDVALRIDGVFGHVEDKATGLKGRYIQTSVEELKDAMALFVQGRPSGFSDIGDTGPALVHGFTWQKAASRLAALTVGLETVASRETLSRVA